MPVPDLDVADRKFQPGKAELVRDGLDVTLIACGTTVHLAAKAAEELEADGVSARVLNMATISPLDEAAIASAAGETGAIVTIEEANIHGGLGGAVAEYTASNDPVPVERMGFPGFVPTGSIEWLFDHFGLTAAGIAKTARKAIGRKRA
jgi:transketolase